MSKGKEDHCENVLCQIGFNESDERFYFVQYDNQKGCENDKPVSQHVFCTVKCLTHWLIDVTFEVE